MDLLIKNIKGLVQFSGTAKGFSRGEDMLEIPELNDAYLRVKDGLIYDFGKMKDLPLTNAAVEIDAKGCFLLPAYIDSHTHIVFPATRETEFEMKLQGATYDEIATAGGGILNSAKAMKNISEDDLLERSINRLNEVINIGTGAIEIKSGYGLDTEGELKMLRVIKKLKAISPIEIKSTFLGAHAVPAGFKNNKAAYLELVINEMLPEVAKNNLADYVDIFIEKGFFSVEDANRLLEAAAQYQLKPKIHVDQLNTIGGVEVGIAHKAVSLDHLECISDQSIENLKSSATVPVLLPSCSFYLDMQYPPARKMIDSGLGVAIASDYNPGSSPSGNLNFSMSLACMKMKMMPAEALNAVTLNAAYALEIEANHGLIAPGYKANLILTNEISSWKNIPYSFGQPLIKTMFINGKIFTGISSR